MKLEQLVKDFGYDDLAQFEANIESYGDPLGEWYDLLRTLVDKFNTQVAQAYADGYSDYTYDFD